jgi:hypothetical protein
MKKLFSLLLLAMVFCNLLASPQKRTHRRHKKRHIAGYTRSADTAYKVHVKDYVKKSVQDKMNQKVIDSLKNAQKPSTKK